MSGVYELIKDRLGMGTENLEVLQEKAQRISILSGFIARKISDKRPFNMSESEIEDVALIARTVHPENESMYQGKEPFNFEKNKIRGQYSLKVAEERGIELTDVQKAVVRGGSDLIEERIIKLAETTIALQYSRVQRGVQKKPIGSAEELMTELLSDPRIDAELISDLIGEQEFVNLVSAEKRSMIQKGKVKKDKEDSFEI